MDILLGNQIDGLVACESFLGRARAVCGNKHHPMPSACKCRGGGSLRQVCMSVVSYTPLTMAGVIVHTLHLLPSGDFLNWYSRT